MTPSVAWDIELVASAGGLGDDTETKTFLILVG
jgi:hypothetical protein